MIRVLVDSAHDAALIAEAIGGAEQVVNGAGRLTGDNAPVECVILCCRSPIPLERLALVQEIHREAPLVPIILVTDPAPNIAPWLAESAVSDIVWLDGVKTELRLRIEAHCRTGALFGLADEIENSTLPPVLRSALTYSLRAATDRPGPQRQATGCRPPSLSRDAVEGVPE